MHQTEKYWNVINRIVFVAVVILAGVGAVLAFAPKVRQMQSYQQTRDQLQQRIDVTEAAEKDLKERHRRFLSDPEYVKKIAHEVGYAHPDEIIFYFPEETAAR